MRVSVITVLQSQEPLIEAAAAFAERRAPQIPMEAARMPAGLELDPLVPAIPIGTGRLADATTAALFEPGQSSRFAVRGFVEAETPNQIPVEIDGRPIFADPRVEPFVTCGGTPAVGNASAVKSKLKVSALAAKGLDGTDVAIAVMDTGINFQYLSTKLGSAPRFDAGNSWTPPGVTNAPGTYPIDHGTMCAYDALIAAPKATLVDFPILAGSAPGATIVGRSLSMALLGFAQLMASWAVGFAPGGLRRYRALVVNNSWGMYHPSWDFPVGHPGRYCDNPNHPFNLLMTLLAASGVDIIYAAGNCGAACADMRCQGKITGTIMGANAHPDVLTLAGCDTTETRVGYSSQGPSVAGMYQQKPDLTSYTHFLGSEAFGAGTPDSGTSAACPVAAGCVAALRTKLAPATTPPANLFAQFRSTARPANGQMQWNGDYGHGILDPHAAASSLGL